jgi:septal ring factor EnvC (AmiA/AmiB activator)
MSDQKISLEFIAEQGSRLLDEIRLVREEQREQRFRLSSLERAVAQIAVDVAQIDARLDRVHDRLDRIEHRLDLVDDPTLA